MQTNGLLKGSWWRSVAGFAISGGLLYLMIEQSGLQISNIHLSLQQALYLTGAMLLFVFSLNLYAWRAAVIWQQPGGGSVPVRTYCSIVLGNFYNGLLPGNLGEGVRVWHFSQKNRQGFVRSLAGVLTEKWLDAQVFAVLVAVFLLLKPFRSHFIVWSLLYVAAAVVVLTVLHLVFLYSRRAEKAVWRIVLLLRQPGYFLFKAYTHTNGHLKNMLLTGNLPRFVLYFLLIFLVNEAQFYCVMKAAGIAAPVAGFYSCFLVSLSMMIIAFIPAAPGNIGVLHYGLYSALILAAGQYGIEPQPAQLQQYALFGVYAHFSFLVPETLLGTVVMIKERNYLFNRQPAKTRAVPVSR